MTAGALFHLDAKMRVALAEAIEQSRPFCPWCPGLCNPIRREEPIPEEHIDLIDN